VSKQLTPEDIRVTAIHRLPRVEYNINPERSEALARDYLHHRMANFIIHERAEETIRPDYREYRLELYVATPDVFYELVQREAVNLAGRYGYARDMRHDMRHNAPLAEPDMPVECTSKQ